MNRAHTLLALLQGILSLLPFCNVVCHTSHHRFWHTFGTQRIPILPNTAPAIFGQHAEESAVGPFQFDPLKILIKLRSEFRGQ